MTGVPRRLLHATAIAASGLPALWLALHFLITWIALPTLATDFCGGMPAETARAMQASVGVKSAAGAHWIHLGWIADPQRQRYRVYLLESGERRLLEESAVGSVLIRGLRAESHYRFEVAAVSLETSSERTLGWVEADTKAAAPGFARPVIASSWRQLFRPRVAGDYVNDHCLFRDASGRWRLWGITGPGRGDYRQERYFAQGLLERTGEEAAGLGTGEMSEVERVADYGESAWAPHVVRGPDGLYHAFWSPHRARHAVSTDGARWRRIADAIRLPHSWFFRDPMVLEVAPGQWLMYASARGWYYSRIDVYQSFDLDHWQPIAPAWTSSWGSERNAIVGSAESPFVISRKGSYYLSITYNNESGLLAPIALALGHWIGGKASYNDSLIFASDNPYRFGEYRGASGRLQPIARLAAHAPEYIRDELSDSWYITTAGWPLAATLTSGEVAIATLDWEDAAAPANSSASGALLIASRSSCGAGRLGRHLRSVVNGRPTLRRHDKLHMALAASPDRPSRPVASRVRPAASRTPRSGHPSS